MDVFGELTERPVGISAFELNSLRDKTVHGLFPSTGTAVYALGSTYFASGTISTPGRLNTNRKTRTWRWVNTSNATAGTVIYHRPPTGEFLRADGFLVQFCGGITTLVPGNRWFGGISENTANPTNIDPKTSTTHGKIGLAVNSNNGNLSLIHHAAGSTPTEINLGDDFPINNTDVWKLELICEPGGNVDYSVLNTTSQISVMGTLSTNLPGLTALLAKSVWGTNNATASAFAMDIARLYSEH